MHLKYNHEGKSVIFIAKKVVHVFSYTLILSAIMTHFSLSIVHKGDLNDVSFLYVITKYCEVSTRPHNILYVFVIALNPVGTS